PFQEVLDQQLQLGMGPNCTYSDWQIFTLIIFGYLCGQDRLAHFEQLSLDSTVQKLLALDSPIDENTLAYRLKKAGYKQSVQLHRVTRALAERIHRADFRHREGRQWLDFDSTIK